MRTTGGAAVDVEVLDGSLRRYGTMFTMMRKNLS